jgi:hypothetical protein
MPHQRDSSRDFPGRRWFNLTLRTVHLAGIVLLGSALLGGGDPATGAGLTFVSGLAMFAGDAWANPGHLREAAGAGVLLKLVLVAAMALVPALALPLFWGILVLSGLLSHAPGAMRHRRLF